MVKKPGLVPIYLRVERVELAVQVTEEVMEIIVLLELVEYNMK